MDWRRMVSDGTLVVLIVLGTLGFGAGALAVALVILGLPGGAWWLMLIPILALTGFSVLCIAGIRSVLKPRKTDDD